MEVALREYPDLTDRAIAELCAVHHDTVNRARHLSVSDTSPAPRTGRDGKQYPPATKPRIPEARTGWETQKVGKKWECADFFGWGVFS